MMFVRVGYPLKMGQFEYRRKAQGEKLNLGTYGVTDTRLNPLPAAFRRTLSKSSPFAKFFQSS